MEEDSQTRITLRLPDDIRDRVASEAKQNNRSMNAEIIARLEASFDGETGLTNEDRKFLISLIGAVRSTRQGLDQQPDVVIQNPDGTVDFVDIKEYRAPASPKRPSPAGGIDLDELAHEEKPKRPPRVRRAVKKTAE